MVSNKSIFFKRKKNKKSIRVLTITATFPSLIQPWLINQLVQIEENGNENLILARRSELSFYSSSIDEYGLLNRYSIVPESRSALLLMMLNIFKNIDSTISFFRGISLYHKILFSSKYSLKEKLYSFFLLQYLGLRGIDLIHSHSEMAGNKFMPIIDALDVPLIITFHGLPPQDVKPISDFERSRYTKHATTILLNTEFSKQLYVSLGADCEKIKIVPQGINLNEFPFKPRVFSHDVEVNILTVGRFHPDKGQQYSIQAIANMIKQGFNIKYRLVGNGPDKNRLISLAEDLGVKNNIEFYSSVTDDELCKIYSQSHIFILPSLKALDGFHEETQGVVLQEAQASGLITIATKVGGIPECLDDGVSGFLVDDRSSDSIQRIVTKLISDSSNWEQYQMLGRKWVEKRYDIKKLGLITNAVYCDIIKN